MTYIPIIVPPTTRYQPRYTGIREVSFTYDTPQDALKHLEEALKIARGDAHTTHIIGSLVYSHSKADDAEIKKLLHQYEQRGWLGRQVYAEKRKAETLIGNRQVFNTRVQTDGGPTSVIVEIIDSYGDVMDKMYQFASTIAKLRGERLYRDGEIESNS